MSLLLFSGGLPRIPLIRPGLISPRLSFARAQTGGVASTTLGSDDATWSEVAADVPRFYGSARRLRIEGAETNKNANPRGEGGSGTSLPTGWSGITSALPITSVTQATINGVRGVTIRFAGTPSTASAAQLIRCGSIDSLAAGSVVTNSVSIALLDGSLGNLSGFLLRCEAEAGGTSLAPSAALERVVNTRAITSTSSSTVIRWVYVDTVTPVDFTLFVGWPQREHNALFASTPIIPPSGTPGASTRGADLVSASLAGARRGLVLWSGLWGQNAPAGVDQMALQIDDGTDANRFRVRNAAGGATVVAGRVAGSASADLTSLGSMTAGAMTSLGLAFDLDTGAYKAMLRGGAVQSGTGGPTSGTALRIGNNVAATAAQFGEVRDLDFIPGIYPGDAEMAARVNAMSLT